MISNAVSSARKNEPRNRLRLKMEAVETDVEIGSLDLRSGARLEAVTQRVTRYGEPLPDGSNVVLVAHALTGSSRPADWWGEVVGAGKLFDTDRQCVIGINVLGGCYGSTGPASLASDGRPYGSRFPIITVEDIVLAQRHALETIGIPHVATVVGGSLGGMQAVAWGLLHHDACREAIVIGAYDHFSAMGIGLNLVARQAILDDPHFAGGEYYDGEIPASGLRLARMIAMLSYKSDVLLQTRFGNRVDRAGGDPLHSRDDRFDVEGYLGYQGDIFVRRMDANTYLALTRAMDLFDLRGAAVASVPTKFTFIGIQNDWLFAPHYVEETAARLTRAGVDATYRFLPSDHGHDAFLAESERLTAILQQSTMHV